MVDAPLPEDVGPGLDGLHLSIPESASQAALDWPRDVRGQPKLSIACGAEGLIQLRQWINCPGPNRPYVIDVNPARIAAGGWDPLSRELIPWVLDQIVKEVSAAMNLREETVRMARVSRLHVCRDFIVDSCESWIRTFNQLRPHNAHLLNTYGTQTLIVGNRTGGRVSLYDKTTPEIRGTPSKLTAVRT